MLRVGIGGYLLLLLMCTILWLGRSFLDISFLRKRNKEASYKMQALSSSIFKRPEVDFSNKASSILHLPLPRIWEKLFLVESLHRPELFDDSSDFLLGLKSDQRKRLVRLGERIYFECFHENDFVFADRATPFWAELVRVERGGIYSRFCMEYHNQQGNSLYRREKNFYLKEGGEDNDSSMNKEELIAIMAYLREVKIYPSDRFIDVYGGEFSDSMQGSFRMMCNDDRNVIFLKEKQAFSWRDGKLYHENEEKEGGFPLLTFSCVDQSHFKASVWNSEGFCVKTVFIDVENIGDSPPRFHEVFAKVSVRTKSSCICRIQGKSYVLRKGDWVACINGQWKIIHAPKLEDIWQFNKTKALFVFEDLVQNSSGEKILIGKMFNEGRMQYSATRRKIDKSLI